jgi:hypothetical protein
MLCFLNEYSDVVQWLRLHYKFFAETSCLHDCIQNIGRTEVMTQEQIISDEEEPHWAAFIAIDWADRVHIWKLQAAESGSYEQGKLEQTPEAIEAWASQLATRLGERPIAVALEQSRGAVVFALTKYRHLHLYPVHPSMLAHFRQAMVPSGSKNDPGDTGLLLELLLHHRPRLRRLKPDTEQTRELQFLVEVRRKLVDDRTCFSNRLTA